MCRSAAQSLHFHSFNETPWHQLVFASWADASDRSRPDGSRTGGYVITLATEKLFGWPRRRCQRIGLAILQTTEVNLLDQTLVGTQALAFANESLWLARLAW